MAEVIELTQDNFDEEVGDSNGVVVVDFWAEWCGPCKMVAPVIAALAEQYEGRVRFAKVNVDEEQEIASFFGIRSIPTIGFFRDGETVGAVVGARPKDHLEQVIEEILARDE